MLKKVVKYVGFLLLTVIVLVGILLLCIDPIAKYAIEKYDKQYTGREIALGNIHINVLNASVEIHDFKLFEKNGKTPFVSFTRFYTQTDYNPLFHHQLNLYPVQLENLSLNIINKNEKLNFDDMLETISKLSSSGKTQKEPDSDKPLDVNVSAVSITGGVFSYMDGNKNVRYWLSDYVLSLPMYSTMKNDIAVTLLTKLNNIANLSLHLKYDLKKQYYDAALHLKHFPMQTLNPYMKEFLRFNKLNSYLTIKSFLKGNVKNASQFSIKGNLNVNDFEFIDAYNQKLTSFKELQIDIDDLNLAQNIYKINAITLKDPYFLFELYPDGNSINRLFQQLDTTVVVTKTDTITKVNPTVSNSSSNVFRYVYDYFKDISKNLILNTYSANKLEIINSTVVYNDFVVGEKMSVETSQLNLKTSRISSSSDSVSAVLTSIINNMGKLMVDFTADAKDFKNMTVNIGIDKFPLTTINPYLKYYTGFPFKKGNLSITSAIKIDDKKLDSQNKFLIEKSKLGKKDKKNREYNVPLKLVFALLKDKKGNVDIDFPVDGNLDDPNYKLRPVVLKLLKNLLVKTVSAPGNLIAGAFAKKDNSVIEIESLYLQTDLSKKQIDALKGLKNQLKDKPELIAEIDFNTDTVKEKELLVIHQIKKRYMNDVLKQDSSKFDNTSDKKIKLTDSTFVAYINQQVEGRAKAETSIIDKAFLVLGKESIQKHYNLIKHFRQLSFQEFIDKEMFEVKSKLKINPITIDKNILNPYHSISLDGAD